MTRRYFIFGLLFVFSLVGCARSVVPSPLATVAPSPLASPETASDVYLVYQRSGGLAGVHNTWTIDRQGNVTQPNSNSVTQLTNIQMNELITAVNAANFMSLENSYVPKDSCCDRYEHTITVTLNGQSKTVHTIDAAPTAPAGLNSLIDLLGKLLIHPTPAAQ